MDAMNEQSLRAALAQAIEARGQADAQLAEQVAAHKRASALVAGLRAEVQEHAATLNRLTDDEAHAVAEQLLRGEAMTLADAVPSVVIEERQLAEQRLAVAHKALAQIERTLHERDVTQKQAVVRVRDAANALLAFEGDRIAEQINANEVSLVELRKRLRGLDFASYGLSQGEGANWQRPKLLTPKAAAALYRPSEPQFVGGRDPAQDDAKSWNQWHVQLTQDSAARHG